MESQHEDNLQTSLTPGCPVATDAADAMCGIEDLAPSVHLLDGEFGNSEGEGGGLPRSTVSPLREMVNVAWPTVLSMTSVTIMQFVDGLMVAYVGPTEVAAQGNGGIWAFLPIALTMGILTIINTFVSQNLGAGQVKQAPKYAWGAIWLGVAFWLAFLPYALVLPYVFEYLHGASNPELVQMESQYGQVLILGAIFVLTAKAISNFFFGLHRPRVVLVATIIGNVANLSANYVLIFGAFGFPEWGLFGAAVGTVFGTMIELILPLAVFLGPKMNRELQSRAAWKPELKVVTQILRVGWPRGLTFANEMVCWAIFMSVIVGTFGEDHMTAGWIALKYMHLSFMPAVGISVAVTAVVGRYIGAGQPEIANHRAYLGVKLAMGYMFFCAVCFVVFRETLTSWFVKTPDAAAYANDPVQAATDAAQAANVLQIGMRLLICAAVFQIFDAVAITLNGALTGAGDTLWPGVANVIASWICIVGIGWMLAIFMPQLESVGPWIGAALFITTLGITFFLRWRAGGWRKIKLVHDSSVES